MDNVFQNVFQRPFQRAFSTAGEFIPSSDPLAFSWYDAADSATVLETADVVTAWNDKIGSQDLTVITSTPTTNTRTVNGLNVIDFDGTEIIASGGAFPTPASGDFAIHFAAVIDAVDDAFDSLMSINNAGSDWQFDTNNMLQFDGQVRTASNGSLALTGGPHSGFAIWSLIFDFTGSIFTVFKDGVSVAGNGTYTTAMLTAGTMRFMGNRAGDEFIDGAFGEVIFTEAVSAAVRAQHVEYLTNKWT